MKKLDFVFTFSGGADKVYDLQGISKPELNKVWRACYAALGFMSDLSDVYTVMEPGPDAGGRSDLRLVIEVSEDKKSSPFNDVTFNWYGMDQSQCAFMLAAFEDQFLKADIDWH